MLTEPATGSLHVETTGTGPPLVLLHGWAMHGGLFGPIVEALSQRHRVHVVDLPGHGFSAPLRPWTLDRVVDVIEARFSAGAAVRVLGWSLGGAIAMRWAQRAPARIERLVLVSATPKFVAAEDWPHALDAPTLNRFGDELRVAFAQTLLRFLTLQTRGSSHAHAALAVLRRELASRGRPERSVLDDALVVLRTLDLRESVRGITHPSLVVAGPRDTLVPPEASAWLARALPNASLAVIDGAGHVPFISHRDAFLDATRAFLDDR